MRRRRRAGGSAAVLALALGVASPVPAQAPAPASAPVQGAARPVPAGLAAARTVEVDVLARPVARGEILHAADFVRGEAGAAAARFALRAEQAEGMEARRLLPAGVSLRAADIAPPTLVRRGDALTLHWRRGALDISAPGRALTDAAAGGAVRVLNLATDKVLDAWVRASGEVEIPAR